MPEISRFLGIVIKMFWNEHNPPYFHAEYGDYKIEIDIKTLAVLKRRLPSRVLGLVIEWVELYQQELLDNWESMQTTTKYKKISPLI